VLFCKEWALPTLYSYNSCKGMLQLDADGKNGRRKLIQIIEKLALEALEGSEIELVDIAYKTTKGRLHIVVFIDKPEGITLDDCEGVSRSLEDLLDIEDPIKSEYTLEVSSPGVERVLKREKDFRRFVGYHVKIRTYEKVNGRKNFAGLLKNFSEGIIQLQTEEGDIYNINLKDIASTNLWFK